MVLELSKRVQGSYIFYRGLASGLAVLFSLFYSKGLGVENRSIVTVIFVTALIFLTLCTSGFSLAFRSHFQPGSSPTQFSAFFWLSIFSAGFVSLAALLSLSLYSHLKSEIPQLLLILAFGYTFWVTLADLSHQALLAFKKFKVAGVIDLLGVFIQIITYVSLNLTHKISLASSLFSSIIISYVISTLLSLIFILQRQSLDFNLSMSSIWDLIRQSKPFQLVGISHGLTDRIDRFLLAWFMPLGFLGSYSVGTSLLVYTRFIPEAIERLIVGKQFVFRFALARISLIRWILTLLLVLGAVVSAALVSKLSVSILLGELWSIPTSVILMFALQEILRGYYYFVIAHFVASTQTKLVQNLSGALVPLSLFNGFIGLKLFGGFGVPLGIAVSYGLLIVLATIKSAQNE